MMEMITQGVVKFNAFLWGAPMMVLIVGISLYFSWKLKFIQKHLFHSISLSLKKSKSAGAVSSFGALVIALAAMVGTGNIVGVAAAVSTGGPGALFWMMLSAFFAMATKYAESVLAVKYREKNEAGEYVGGPMYVLKNGLNMKKTAAVFAVATALMGFADALIQTNSLVAIYDSVFKAPAAITTAVLVVLTATVILGGVRKIAAFCKWLVPLMAIVYIVLCLIVIVMHLDKLPWAIACIFKSAFTGTAVLGGAVGITLKEAVRYGVSRGVLSNEAGSGSGAIAAAAALFVLLPAAAQMQEAYPSYIQVYGRAEKEITPDEFYLQIVINERDSKGKISVESQQREMIAALKRAGVDVEKQLKVANLSSEFFKKNTSVASAKYQLQLGSAAEVSKVWQALGDLGISDVSILKVSHSRIGEYKREVRLEAMRNAQQSAREMAEAVGQTIGRCFYIYDANNDVMPLYYDNAVVMRSAKLAVAEGAVEEEPLDFKTLRLEYSVQAKFVLE